MITEQLFYTLALNQIKDVGDITAKKLLNYFTDAKSVFSAKKQEILRIDGVGEVVYKNLQNKEIFKKAENEISYIEKNNINIHYFKDNNYPEKLKYCIDAPVLLFSSGNINLSHSKIISIVGTRKITSYGAEFLKQFIQNIAPFNPIIVSGFAYGVDISAHINAIDNNLQNIAILAHGLKQYYPKPHKKYAEKIKENGGFITEFWSSSNPDKENFVKRNRIVAGISEATIVIESAEKGGSLITAKLANDYNREVFALPGRSTDNYSLGCNNLIKTQQAHLITSAADVAYLLNWQLSEKENKIIQKQLFVSLDNEEQFIYDYLQKNGKQLLDIISLECQIPVFKLSGILLNMELKGVIRPLPGKLFEAV